MDVAIRALILVVVCIAGYVWGRARRVHELRYQRRMAEKWYVAYRVERGKRFEDSADFWKDA